MLVLSAAEPDRDEASKKWLDSHHSTRPWELGWCRTMRTGQTFSGLNLPLAEYQVHNHQLTRWVSAAAAQHSDD
jgi:hypothetical protein